jgi:hypothetical protein
MKKLLQTIFLAGVLAASPSGASFETFLESFKQTLDGLYQNNPNITVGQAIDKLSKNSQNKPYIDALVTAYGSNYTKKQSFSNNNGPNQINNHDVTWYTIDAKAIETPLNNAIIALNKITAPNAFINDFDGQSNLDFSQRQQYLGAQINNFDNPNKYHKESAPSYDLHYGNPDQTKYAVMPSLDLNTEKTDTAAEYRRMMAQYNAQQNKSQKMKQVQTDQVIQSVANLIQYYSDPQRGGHQRQKIGELRQFLATYLKNLENDGTPNQNLMKLLPGNSLNEKLNNLELATKALNYMQDYQWIVDKGKMISQKKVLSELRNDPKFTNYVQNLVQGNDTLAPPSDEKIDDAHKKIMMELRKNGTSWLKKDSAKLIPELELGKNIFWKHAPNIGVGAATSEGILASKAAIVFNDKDQFKSKAAIVFNDKDQFKNKVNEYYNNELRAKNGAGGMLGLVQSPNHYLVDGKL